MGLLAGSVDVVLHNSDVIVVPVKCEVNDGAVNLRGADEGEVRGVYRAEAGAVIRAVRLEPAGVLAVLVRHSIDGVSRSTELYVRVKQRWARVNEFERPQVPDLAVDDHVCSARVKVPRPIVREFVELMNEAWRPGVPK